METKIYSHLHLCIDNTFWIILYSCIHEVEAVLILLYNSQRKLEKNLEQIPYQNIFVPRSCIRSGLVTQNLFTLDIHRRIFRRVKSKMAEDLTEIT